MSRSPLSPARRCALEALMEWEETSHYASDILSQLAKRHRLSSADRGLAQDLIYGVIRHIYLLDGLIEKLRRGSLKLQTRLLLRLGLYQLFLTEIAEYAAVHETVELARPHERSLVNAILRNAQRQKIELLAEIETWPLEERCSHPDFLIQRWTRQYGAEAAAALCHWNNDPAPVYARLNSLARDKDAYHRVQSAITPSLLGPSHPLFFRVDGAPDHDQIEQGLIYVQDPSTSLACELLAPQSREKVLDACAAPGGKTSHLAALMGDYSTLVASDSVPARLRQMTENLQRLGIDDLETRQVDWSRPDSAQDLAQFDAILLDAPCSNTGVMRRRIDVRWRLQDRDFDRYAKRQLTLLQSVAGALKPGGRIVYSTCSLEHVENEGVIEASGLTIEEVRSSLPWRDGYDGAFAALLRI